MTQGGLFIQADGSQANVMLQQINDGIQKIAQNTTKVPPPPEVVKTKWEQLTESIKKSFSSLTSVQGMMMTVFSASALNGIGSAIKNTESLNNQLIALKQHRAFEGIRNDFEKIKEITHGLASQLDLVPSISRATAFGIDMSNGRLEKFITLSQKLGIVMGKDIKSSFDDLVTGVGRQSVLIMDNLGILIKRSEAYEKYAKLIGVATNKLSAEQRMTAFLNETLEKGNEIVKNMDMSKFEMQGSQAIASLEQALSKFKKTLISTFVDFGDAIGKAGFIMKSVATLDFDSIKALYRAEAKERLDNEIKEAVAKKRALLKVDEHFIAYEKRMKMFGATQEEIFTSYYENYTKKVTEMSDYGYKWMVINQENNLRGIETFIKNMQQRIEDFNATQLIIAGVDTFSDKMSKYTDKKNKEQKIANDKYADLMNEYFGDGGLLDEIQQKQHEKDLKDISDEEDKIRKVKLEKLNLRYEKIGQAELEKVKELNSKLGKFELTDDLFEESDKTKSDRLLYESKIKLLSDFNKQYKTNLKISFDDINKITHSNLKAQLQEEAVFQQSKKDISKDFLNETANFTSTIMNDVLLGEKKWNKEMLGDFVKMMGTKNIVSGTTKVFEGLGEMLWGSFATGSGLVKVGSAQILAGIGMGGIGKAIGVTPSKKDEKSSATDKSNIDKSKQKNEIGITTYLYPNSKSYYRQQLLDKRVIN